MSSLASPVAFVHVDMDNLWAIAECYGLDLPAGLNDFIYHDALPRLQRLFAEAEVRSTLFVVGRDLEARTNVNLLRVMSQDGHRFANHSWSHLLSFRTLAAAEMEREIVQAEEAIWEVLGERPTGFRAPGYGISPRLLEILGRRGYQYDASAMPGPYGPVFRWLDRRLRAGTPHGNRLGSKTQYSRLSDFLSHPLAPHQAGDPAHPVLEIPSATSPLLRLPFQAGVCLRLGRRYFETHLAAFRRRPGLPLLFLLHAADVADLAALDIPFFRNSPFFSAPVGEKEAGIACFLSRIREFYDIQVTEEWLEGPAQINTSPKP